MKKLLYLFAGLLMVHGAVAQNAYDVMRLGADDLNGTARYVGMGGAMSSLGADITSTATNPAGIALYRKGDAVATFGLHNVKNESLFHGTGRADTKSSFTIENLGMVFSTCPGGSSVKFVNLAFNYRHSNNFRNSMEIAGSLTDADGNYFSQQYQLHEMYRISEDFQGWEDYYSLDYPWLGLLTSTSGLIGDDGELKYLPTKGALYPQFMNYRSEEKGGVDEVDVTLAANVDDMFYFGVTLTASNVDYTRTSSYTEHCDRYDYYTLQNSFNTNGHGFGMKFGAIMRPMEYSPLKLGVSVHTPTWYNLTDRYSAAMIGDDGTFFDTRDYDGYGDDLYIDYDYTTPWRFNVSGSYTFGKFAALSAEYELVDYTTSKIEYTDGYNMDALNEEIEYNMRSRHILRVGAQFNIDDNIALRCGYNYMTSPYKKSAAKTVFKNCDTSTEYMNLGATNVFTLGAGYTGDLLYFDIAYKLSVQQADFYNYYDSKYVNPAADMDITRQSLIMSMGVRF